MQLIAAETCRSERHRHPKDRASVSLRSLFCPFAMLAPWDKASEFLLPKCVLLQRCFSFSSVAFVEEQDASDELKAVLRQSGRAGTFQ